MKHKRQESVIPYFGLMFYNLFSFSNI